MQRIEYHTRGEGVWVSMHLLDTSPRTITLERSGPPGAMMYSTPYSNELAFCVYYNEVLTFENCYIENFDSGFSTSTLLLALDLKRL